MNQEEPDDVTDLSDEIKAMDNMDTGQMLVELKKAQLKELLAKARMGILTHQEHSVIARLLADNGLVMPDGSIGGDPKKPSSEKTGPSSDKDVGTEDESLPVFDPDEEFT